MRSSDFPGGTSWRFLGPRCASHDITFKELHPVHDRAGRVPPLPRGAAVWPHHQTCDQRAERQVERGCRPSTISRIISCPRCSLGAVSGPSVGKPILPLKPTSIQTFETLLRQDQDRFGTLCLEYMFFIFVLRVTALLLDCKMVMCQYSILSLYLFPFFDNNGALLAAYMKIRKPFFYICFSLQFFKPQGGITLGGISFWVSPECFGTGEVRWFF